MKRLPKAAFPRVYYNIDSVKCIQWDQDNKEEWSDVPCNAKDNVFVCEKDGKANMTLTTRPFE